ncbi:hypothetical protein C6P43_004080 [Kluyveromyces marxianus]|nr:hypothetical protein C6P43_004080 [Kluyveromyces marxianus]
MATLSTRSWSIWSSFFGEVSRSIAADDSRVIPEAGCGSTTGVDDMLMSGTSDSSFTSVFTEVGIDTAVHDQLRQQFSRMDPFIQVYNDTEEQLNQLLQILEKKKKGRSNTSPHEIAEILSEAQETVQDLNDSVLMMRQEQAVPEEEVRAREHSMKDLESKLKQCESLQSEDSFDVDLEAGGTTAAPITTASGLDDTQTTPDNSQDAIQEQLLREQDSQLDSIHQTMQNLHLQASTMGQELTEQGMILEEIDGDIDGVMSKLSRGRRQLEWVYEHNKEKVNDCCIFLLIVALIVLLVLAFIL